MAKILLVEDNEMNRDVLSRRLERKGYEIVVAVDGQQALEMTSSESPDLILMDLSLPIMDGWEATRRLKADKVTSHIPVIALTAHAMSGDRAKALEAGCDDYDTKPFDLPRLLTKIQTLLDRPVEAQAAPASVAAPAVEESEEPVDEVISQSRPRGRVLVVDDNEENRDLLIRRLMRENYPYFSAENGEEALKVLEEHSVDLVLLDIMMPVMDGYEVLQRMKADTAFRHIPVIVISASQETESVVKCIEMGADDYLPKPCDPVLLKARISACIEKKKLRDQELVFREQIEMEKQRSDDLLHAIFPHAVVQELMMSKQYRPRRYENVAVLFSDIVGFTPYCEQRPPEEVVELLQHHIIAYEEASRKYELQKIKTIGDAYMAACGLYTRVDNPVLNCLKCGLEMLERAKQLPPHWQLRIGIHFGSVVGGIVGQQQYALDIWGDTVNTASRVEHYGVPGTVCISGSAWLQIAHQARGESRMVDVRGKGTLEIVQFKGFLQKST